MYMNVYTTCNDLHLSTCTCTGYYMYIYTTSHSYVHQNTPEHEFVSDGISVWCMILLCYFLIGGFAKTIFFNRRVSQKSSFKTYFLDVLQK